MNMKNNTSAISKITMPTYPRHPALLLFFSLGIITSWLAISYFLYDLSLYYLYQVIPRFAQLLNIIVLFVVLLAILYFFNQIYCYFFRRTLNFTLYATGISISSATSADSFAWQELAALQLKQRQGQAICFQLITIAPSATSLEMPKNPVAKNLNYYFQSWLAPSFRRTSLALGKNSDWMTFWKAIEKHTRPMMQKNILYQGATGHDNSLKNSPFKDNTPKDSVHKNNAHYDKTHPENTQQNQIKITQLIANPTLFDATQRRSKRYTIGLVIGFIALSVLIFFAVLWRELTHPSVTVQGQEQTYSGTNFKAIDNQVYIFKQGEGKLPLPHVKAEQFTGLALEDIPQRAPELYSNVGKTEKHVYWQDHILQQLNPAETTYLGNDYNKDLKHVYFQNHLLDQADAKSFQSILHPVFNVLGFYYAKDKQHVYYKTFKLNDLSPQSVSTFHHSDQYIYDQKHVYYQNQKLEQLNPSKTQIFVGENRFSQDVNLATDGDHFYFNANVLPNVADYQFFGEKSIRQKDLQILGIQHNEPYPGLYAFIFCDHDTIYLYDEFYHRLKVLYQFKQTAPLHVLSDRHFQYGVDTFHISETLVRSKSRTRGTTTHGFKIQLRRDADDQVIATYFARQVHQFSPKRLINTH